MNIEKELVVLAPQPIDPPDAVDKPDIQCKFVNTLSEPIVQQIATPALLGGALPLNVPL